MVISKAFDIDQIRSQFPVLHQQANGKPLIYLDNAATTQKPISVINQLVNYYQKDNANIHRGIHTLAERATVAFEETRKTAARFIHAPEVEEVIFTYGVTDGLNLVAQAYGRKFLKPGDEILVTAMEHHSNIVPWQIVCQQTGANLKVVDILENGELNLDSFHQQLTEKTKIVSVVYISNALGTINPVKHIVEAAHQKGAIVILDGAQAGPHLKIDVKQLNVDFLVLSAHKMYGPTGVGILYGKRKLLEKMDPFRGGGEMIKEVSFKGTTYNDIPYKFEAGTPNIADVVAFKYAMDWINEIGHKAMQFHENQLLSIGTQLLTEIEGLKIIGQAKEKASVISFVVDQVHAFDLGVMLDAQGIAIRTGHHCTQPLMDRLGIEGTSRASFAIYNSTEEVEHFATVLSLIIRRLRK